MRHPHEWVFGGYVAVTSLWLALAAGPFDTDTLTFVGVLTGLVAAARLTPDRLWRVRLAAVAVAMNVCFFAMGSAVPKIRSVRMDAPLRAIDAALLGETPSVALQTVQTPLLTEVLSACYVLFFPMLTVALIVYLCTDRDVARAFYAGLFTLYGIGFMGYVLVPAAGPYLALPDAFDASLEGFAITRLNAAVVARGSNGVDVFPSLHCAVSTYILLFDRTHQPRRFRLYLIPCVGLWVATIYLRYHYAIDVVCGFALAALALAVARRNERCATS